MSCWKTTRSRWRKIWSRYAKLVFTEVFALSLPRPQASLFDKWLWACCTHEPSTRRKSVASCSSLTKHKGARTVSRVSCAEEHQTKAKSAREANRRKGLSFSLVSGGLIFACAAAAWDPACRLHVTYGAKNPPVKFSFLICAEDFACLIICVIRA